jgi:hypothetical protein
MIQFDQKALRDCIKDAVREELHLFISDVKHTSDNTENRSSEKLFTKKEMADELDISLVSLTEWMKQGHIPSCFVQWDTQDKFSQFRSRSKRSTIAF